MPTFTPKKNGMVAKCTAADLRVLDASIGIASSLAKMVDDADAKACVEPLQKLAAKYGPKPEPAAPTK